MLHYVYPLRKHEGQGPTKGSIPHEPPFGVCMIAQQPETLPRNEQAGHFDSRSSITRYDISSDTLQIPIKE